MDLALALLLLWGLLFVPLGIVLHWLVLGEGSRVRALPLAPLTGIATAFAVLATLGRLGIDAGDAWVPWAFLAVSVACVVVIWRRGVEWRSRELMGAGALLFLAVLLLQLPVIGDDGDGPLGYGTSVNPVAEVAAIDAAADGPAADLGIAEAARDGADERAIGFEQFAALTVALGVTDDPEDERTTTWSAYGLHSSITGMLAALVTLPLFAFARARGVGWLGLVVLVPLGVLAPAVFLGLANGEGAAVASVGFTTAAVFSLLVTRRDRGWWALVVLFGAAIAATAGPIALLPLVCVGIAWMLLRSDTYEHLSQHDAPVAQLRTLAVTGIAAGLGGIAVVPMLASGGEQLSWSALHDSLWDAARSWPFAWLDSNLMAIGPDTALETAIWLIGPALLAVAVIYAIVRNERRELGVLVGAILGAVLALVIGLIDSDAGIRLYEFTMLSLSPFLAALAIRAVSLARENASDRKGTPEGRWAGVGPTVLVVAFVVLSFAATAVTGTRMVHAPRVDYAAAAEGDGERTTLIAAGDPWLAFVVDGERVPGGYADADAVSEERSDLSTVGARTTGYDQLIVSSSPLSSDPSLRYIEQSDYDRYQVRLFRDRTVTRAPTEDAVVDPGRILQRTQSQVSARGAGAGGAGDANTDANADAADGDAPDADTTPDDAPGSDAGAGTGSASGSDADAADTDSDSDPGTGTADADADAAGDVAVQAAAGALDLPAFQLAMQHTPVEGADENTPADRPAGRLLPDGDVTGCPVPTDSIVRPSCAPEEPLRGAGCTDADVAASRAPDDVTRRGSAAARGASAGAARAGDAADPDTQVLEVDADPQLPERPTMIGVQCFDVPLAADSGILLVHMRDVGHILSPEDARARGRSGAWDTEREDGREGGTGGVFGGVRRVTSELDASLTYGSSRLPGNVEYDVVLEGTFGAGVEATSSLGGIVEDDDPLPPTELGSLSGSANGFSQILRGMPVNGDVTITNRAGTDIELGRLFARPRDFPRACDVPIAIADGEQREVRLDVRSADGSASIERPGLTVSVVGVTGTGSTRVARVAVASYLSRAGLPRYTLVDWTEQYESDLEVEGCDGAIHREEGAAPPGDEVVLDEEALASAIGGGDASSSSEE